MTRAKIMRARGLLGEGRSPGGAAKRAGWRSVALSGLIEARNGACATTPRHLAGSARTGPSPAYDRQPPTPNPHPAPRPSPYPHPTPTSQCGPRPLPPPPPPPRCWPLCAAPAAPAPRTTRAMGGCTSPRQPSSPGGAEAASSQTTRPGPEALRPPTTLSARSGSTAKADASVSASPH